MTDYMLIKLDKLTRSQVQQLQKILAQTHTKSVPWDREALRAQDEVNDVWEDVEVWTSPSD